MKTTDLDVKPIYSCYLLTDKTLEKLLELFPPKYERTIAHHITVRFKGINKDDFPPEETIQVIGYVDSKDGLEALVAQVGDSSKRPDGSVYHITWSLRGSYKPYDSNLLLRQKGYMLLDDPIEIEADPCLMYPQNKAVLNK